MAARALAACLLAAAAAAAPLPGERDLSKYTYELYLKEFRGVAGSLTAPDPVRQRVFERNLALIRQQNADPAKSWFATVNEFTDWTNEEFRARRTGRRADIEDLRSPEQLERALPSDLPASVDWRTKTGVLTSVKNQGGCGSCWAFSAVETLESHLAIATGEPSPVLSEQQVVSCMANPQQCGGAGGCQGATQPLAFNYTRDAGITLESSYPYRGTTGTCSKSQIKPVAKNDGFVQLKVNDYTALMTAVATKGPVAISLAAGSLGWQLYGGGVFGGGTSACGYDQDHGVQLAGYGADGGKLYWVVRNSWGPGWGEHGYMRILRYGEGKEPCGVDKTPADGEACKGDAKPRTYCGVCGIMGSSSYPTGVRKVQTEVVV